MADHKRITPASDIAPLVQRLAVRLGVGQAAEARTESDAWLDAVTAELTQNRGASIVIAGDRQPPLVHALVHAINRRAGQSRQDHRAGATGGLRSRRSTSIVARVDHDDERWSSRYVDHA